MSSCAVLHTNVATFSTHRVLASLGSGHKVGVGCFRFVCSFPFEVALLAGLVVDKEPTLGSVIACLVAILL